MALLYHLDQFQDSRLWNPGSNY